MGSIPATILSNHDDGLCPQDNGTIWSSGGRGWDILRNYDFLGDDLPAQPASNFTECIIACDNYKQDDDLVSGASCIAVVYQAPDTNGISCYLKAKIDSVVSGPVEQCAAHRTQYAISAEPMFTSSLSSVTSVLLSNTTSILPSGTSIFPSITSITLSVTSILPSNTNILPSNTNIFINGTSIPSGGTSILSSRASLTSAPAQTISSASSQPTTLSVPSSVHPAADTSGKISIVMGIGVGVPLTIVLACLFGCLLVKRQHKSPSSKGIKADVSEMSGVHSPSELCAMTRLRSIVRP